MKQFDLLMTLKSHWPHILFKVGLWFVFFFDQQMRYGVNTSCKCRFKEWLQLQKCFESLYFLMNYAAMHFIVARYEAQLP